MMAYGGVGNLGKVMALRMMSGWRGGWRRKFRGPTKFRRSVTDNGGSFVDRNSCRMSCIVFGAKVLRLHTAVSDAVHEVRAEIQSRSHQGPQQLQQSSPHNPVSTKI